MPVVTLKDLYHSFGDAPVLDHVSLSIEPGERICLVGRNGEGKSTLLKLIGRKIKPDNGEVIYASDIRVTELRQDVPASEPGSIYDVVARGVGELGQIITDWHHAALEASENPEALKRLEALQNEIEIHQGWTIEQRISSAISLLKLPADETFDAQSGGLKRRVLLAQALVAAPDLLLLDEPTNHLDIDSIIWLENFLKNFRGAILFITHDRSFLQNLATRIIDLDRGQLSSWPGDYQKYLQGKQQQLDAEQSANALFDKKLAQEETWIRQGIKARRTRNEGRVRALKKMRDEHSQRRQQQGKSRFSTQQAEQSGKIVIEAEQVTFGWKDQAVIKDFSCKILRGDKVGIIGANGCGKSTLIQLLLKQIEADSGKVKNGTKLEIAYFDQQRNTLDLEKSVRDNIADGSDKIEFKGSSRHVIGYLKDFLFTPKQVNAPTHILSGGERNRLMLARLFTRPFNLLVMDEPTNDLDMDTLELLEELLAEYQGTLLLVSHDRAFIDNLVDYCLVFEGDGQVNEYVGGYEDWLRQRPQVESKPTTKTESKKANKPARTKRKLGYNEQKELKALPRKIEKCEQQIEALQEKMADPSFYQQDQAKIGATHESLGELEKELESLFERWEELESDD